VENQKNNKGVITLLIVIIVILSVLCVLLATGTISFKSNEVNTNKPNDNITDNVTDNNELTNNDGNESTENNDIERVVLDNENKTDQCLNINDGYAHENREVVINNISIKNKNYTFRYVENHTNRTIKVYINNNVAYEGQTSEALLLNVCNYGNYIVYSTGWEGAPFYRIIDTTGKVVMSFVGNKVTYSNGVLSVEELDKNDIENINDNELIKYQLNMNSENLQKENLTVEKYVCNPNGAGYDC